MMEDIKNINTMDINIKAMGSTTKGKLAIKTTKNKAAIRLINSILTIKKVGIKENRMMINLFKKKKAIRLCNKALKRVFQPKYPRTF